MRVGILGCGWLGFPLAKTLIKRGYEINGSTTRDEKIASLEACQIKAFKLIISDNEIVGEVNEFLDCDALIVDFPPKRDENVISQYPSQVELLKSRIVESGIRKIIFISSTSVYPNSNGIVTEDTPLNPARNSGKALIKAEETITSPDNPFKTTIIRFSGLIGSGRNPGRFLANKSNLPGGNSPVNLIHLEDCIELIHAVLKENKWGEIFNGASPDHPTRKEYYIKAAEKTGLTPPEFDEEKDSPYKIIDGSRAEKVLKFKYKHTDLLASFD